MTPPAWTAAYVGLPYRAHGRDAGGVDCWGLVRLVLAERFGTELPSYAGDYADPREAEEVAALIRGEMGEWAEVPPGEAREGDVILLRILGHPAHVGIVAAPGWMLHAQEGSAACLERWSAPAWARRVLGVFRWRG